MSDRVSNISHYGINLVLGCCQGIHAFEPAEDQDHLRYLLQLFVAIVCRLMGNFR